MREIEIPWVGEGVSLHKIIPRCNQGNYVLCLWAIEPRLMKEHSSSAATCLVARYLEGERVLVFDYIAVSYQWGLQGDLYS